MGALRFVSLALGAVGGPMHPCSAKGGRGMYWVQPGQRAQKAEDQGQEHAGWSMIFGLSANGRLYIYFDWPLAWQLHNGVRWW